MTEAQHYSSLLKSIFWGNNEEYPGLADFLISTVGTDYIPCSIYNENRTPVGLLIDLSPAAYIDTFNQVIVSCSDYSVCGLDSRVCEVLNVTYGI